jgi:hypothetical protein
MDLEHGATNEPMVAMLEDQIELSASSQKKLFQSEHYK